MDRVGSDAQDATPIPSRATVVTLLETHYPGLLQLLRRKIRDEHLAEDLLNQAVMVTLEHLQSGRIGNPDLIGGYVFQVAMNLLRNHRRKHAERGDRRAAPDTIDDLPAAAAGDEHTHGLIAAKVQEMLRALPTQRDQIIVKRFYLDEDEKADICRDLGLSPLHFDKVIFRARQRMRELLESRGFSRNDFFGCFLVVLAP